MSVYACARVEESVCVFVSECYSFMMACTYVMGHTMSTRAHVPQGMYYLV